MKKIIYFMSKGLHYVAQIIILVMMFIVTIDVFGRFFFNQPLKGTVEITELGLALVVFFGLSYTHIAKEHITIDFIVDKFSEKIQLVINSAINLLIGTLMGLVAWQLWENSQRLLNAKAVTGDLGIPVYIFVILAAIGTVVFAFTAILNVIVSIQKVVKKNES